MVAEVGLEPTRLSWHQILSLACLPIPPFGLIVNITDDPSEVKRFLFHKHRAIVLRLDEFCCFLQVHYYFELYQILPFPKAF